MNCCFSFAPIRKTRARDDWPNRCSKAFRKRIEALRDAEVDLDSLEHPEVSGIAGLSVTDTFSFFIVRWLLKSHPQPSEHLLGLVRR